MTNIYFDIETIPTQRDDIKAVLLAAIKPPGTYKKAESIAEWFRTEADAAMEVEYRKTGLDGAYGEVIVIGVAVDDAEPVTFSGPEVLMLNKFNLYLDTIKNPNDTQTIGHNVVAFDLRFLVHRYMVNGVKPHKIIRMAYQVKPWDTDIVYDTMTQWAGVKERVSLDKLCRALNIKSPKEDGIDGTKVWDYFQAGRLAEIEEYCARDVVTTREVYKRMTFQYED